MRWSEKLIEIIQKFGYTTVLVIIFVLSVWVRVWQFPSIPAGLNQDEAAAGYESYSLLKTGMDKWGNVFPAYFPGLGDGQSVLMSYLAIPGIWLWGLSIATIRLPELVFGLLMIPLVYLLLRQFDRRIALVGTALVGLTPWHWILSRWALDANMLPFFTTLFMYVLLQAFVTSQKRWILPALPLAALALYAYGVSVVVLPPLVIACGLVFYQYWLPHWKIWLASAGFGLVVAFPFLLYIVKNYIIHASFSWEQYLPFTSPLLIASRFEQKPHFQEMNEQFLRHGLNDGSNYSTIPGFNVLFDLVQPFSLVGIAVILVGVVAWVRYKHFEKERVPLSVVFLLWAAAACIPYFLFDLNINRANSIYIPLISLAAFGIIGVYDVLRRYIRGIHIIFACWLFSLFVWHVLIFGSYYFHEYNSVVGPSFNEGLEPATTTLPPLTLDRPVYVSGFSIVYSYVGVFAQYDPQVFHSSSTVYTTAEKYYHVYRMGNYVFDREIALQYPQYYYVGHADDRSICLGVRSQVQHFALIEQGLCTQEKK